MPSPPDPPPITSDDLQCAVCGTSSWVEVERDSIGPDGPGTRWSCQQCGAHRVLVDPRRRS